MYALGALLALLYYVPLLNLMVPVLSGLAFTHFGLAELARLRRVNKFPSPPFTGERAELGGRKTLF